MKAFLKNYRQAPRKVRLLADMVRGKNVTVAVKELSFVSKRAALPMQKLIESAVANAKVIDEGVKTEDLFIKTISVDKGITLQRMMPRARGRASRIHKESSHIRLELGERKEVPKVKKAPTKKNKKAVANEA